MSKLLILFGLTLLVWIPSTLGAGELATTKDLLAKVKDALKIGANDTCDVSAEEMTKRTDLEARLSKVVENMTDEAIMADNVTAWTAEWEPLKAKLFCKSGFECKTNLTSTCQIASGEGGDGKGPEINFNSCGKLKECVNATADEIKDPGHKLKCWLDACPVAAGGNKLVIPETVFVALAFASFNLRSLT